MALKLSAATLDAVARLGVAVPAHGREALRPGILHFGPGNFHRAHQAVYLDRLFGMGRDRDWGILLAGVTPFDAPVREALTGQDLLGTVVEQEAGGSVARVTRAHAGFLPVGDAAAIGAALDAEETRIVSLTITEGGYALDPASGRFDPSRPEIQADARAPGAPKTVFGHVVGALARRRAAGRRAFTVMSCDNIPHNGLATRDAVVGLAALSDPSLAEWILREAAFPNSMVDRITPATGARERALLAADFGLEDAWPVFCEGFAQWVLEDRFAAGRPALEQAGVEIVAEAAPYEAMKIRILNGGHAVIAYPAGILGIEFAHEAMADPQISAFLEKIGKTEILPVVTPPPGVDLEAYRRRVAERFANPRIADTVRRLCLDGSNRQPKFIVPTIADHLARGRAPRGLALASALWCRYCSGETETGAVVAPNDPDWSALKARAGAARENPQIWLDMDSVYGPVGRDPAFAKLFAEALDALWREGVRATLARHLSGAS